MARSRQTAEQLTFIVSEQRKEIARLQKALARMEVKKGSEIERLKAALVEEKKNKLNVIVDRSCANAKVHVAKET